MSMDPGGVFASTETIEHIGAICGRLFHDQNDADECYVFVLEKLKEDDFRRLRSFEGRSTFKTFLFTVVHSLAYDFRRHKYGRKRIPAAISRIGPLAERLYRLLCFERYSLGDAYELTSLEGLFTGSFTTFLGAIEPIRSVSCPDHPSFLSTDSGEEPLRDIPHENENPLEQLMEKLDLERRIAAGRIIRQTTAGFSELDQMLVHFVFGSDLPVTQAASALGITIPAARKRLKALLTEYRARLLENGIREA